MRTDTIRDTLGREVKDLRVSVIDACNFRCPYCMPAEIFDHYAFLKKDELLSFEEMTRLIKHFVTMGVNKIRLTGGEPLVRKGVEQLVQMIAAIPAIKDIALTTNGYLLAQKAQLLRDAGLKRVTVSLDSLNEQVFKKMAGRDVQLQRVLDGISTAKAVGFEKIKVNTVVKRGVNDEDIVSIASYFKGTGITVRFIEYMDVGSSNGWVLDHVVTADEIVDRIGKKFPLQPVEIEPGHISDVAKRFAYTDGSGEIGIISSVSQPFCRSCVRARLSAEGKLFTCLFATDGTDLRAMVRSGINDEELYDNLCKIWQNRNDRYSELRQSIPVESIGGLKRVEMFKMGG